MNIFVKNTEEQYLVVEFTEEELSNELLQETIETILNKYNGEQIENTLHITPHHDQKTENIGILVDDVREDLMGDVVQTFKETEVVLEEAVVDVKGKITKPAVTKTEMVMVEKDLSNCPCLSFTQLKVEEPIIKEEVKEEVEGELRVQEPILESKQ